MGARLLIPLTLIIASTAKLSLFDWYLSFCHFDAWKTESGVVVSLILSALWWLTACSLGRSAAIIAWILQALYLTVCWSYFTYFGLYLSVYTVLSSGNEGATAVGHGAIPLSLPMLWILLDLPFLLLWLRYRESKPANWRVAGVCATLLTIVTGLLWWRTHAVLRHMERDRMERYSAPTVFVPEFGLLAIQVHDLLAGPNGADGFHYGASLRTLSSGSERRDILLIQCESLDVGGIEWAMPLLAARIPSGIYYPQCLSFNGPGGSSDADVAIIAGCQPLWDRVSFDVRGYAWPHSWVAELRRAGWSAALAHGLPGIYFNFAQVMPRLGFDLWDLTTLGLRQHPGEFGARDTELVTAVLARLPLLPSPRVLHVVTMSSHAPFQNHKAWWNGPRLTSDDQANDYLSALAAIDAPLDRLISGFLTASPTGLVVIFGDHAANVDRPGWQSAITRDASGQREYVPLLFIGAGLTPRRDERLASFLDIGVTLFNASNENGHVLTWGADLLQAGQVLPPIPYRDHQIAR